MFIKNKKGFALLPEVVLKLVIAALCLVILFGVLSKIYFSNLEDKELEQARETIEKLEQDINDIESNQIREFNVYAPVNNFDNNLPFITEKWIFLFFDSDFPEKCSNKCICICKGDDVDSCNKAGECIETDFNLNEKIEINKVPLVLEINSKDNLISIKK